MLNAYRKKENLEKADFYLLKGIYDYDPEAADFKYLYQLNDLFMPNNDPSGQRAPSYNNLLLSQAGSFKRTATLFTNKMMRDAIFQMISIKQVNQEEETEH